jgi:hypothetical protein
LDELIEYCYPGQIAHWGQHDHEEIMTQEDGEILAPACFIEDVATEIVNGINKDNLTAEHYAQLTSLANIYMQATESINSRYGIYNTHLDNSSLDYRKKVIRTIKSLVPNAETSINEETMSNENKHQTNVGKLIWQIIGFIIMMIGLFFYLSM